MRAPQSTWAPATASPPRTANGWATSPPSCCATSRSGTASPARARARSTPRARSPCAAASRRGRAPSRILDTPSRTTPRARCSGASPSGSRAARRGTRSSRCSRPRVRVRSWGDCAPRCWRTRCSRGSACATAGRCIPMAARRRSGSRGARSGMRCSARMRRVRRRRRGRALLYFHALSGGPVPVAAIQRHPCADPVCTCLSAAG